MSMYFSIFYSTVDEADAYNVLQMFLRPLVRSNGRTYKINARDVFLSFFFSPTVLQAPLTDRPETLPPDRNLA